MTLKKIGYINDPFRYVDCFKLTCYKTLDTCHQHKDVLWFNNSVDILPYIEELVKLEKQLISWKKWMKEGVHNEEESDEVWGGKEREIISKFQEIYTKIQNKAIEQFQYIDEMDLLDSGFSINYIDINGYENDLEVV